MTAHRKPNAKSRLKYLCLPGVWLACGAVAMAQGLGDYLPQDKADGHFMRVTVPDRAAELSQKMTDAVSKNKEWYLEYIQKAKPGEPLPYDPKFGLTPDEYKELLQLITRQTLKEMAVLPLSVTHNSDGSISLVAGNNQSQILSGIKFDPAKNTVSTPYGDLANPKSLDNSGKGQGGAWGPFKGIEFHLEEGLDNIKTADLTHLTGKAITLTLGKVIDTGKRFIMYDVKVVKDGKPAIEPIEMYLEY